MLHRLIYYLGMLKRNPSLLEYYNFLKESDFWSLEKLQKYQLEKAKVFFQFVYEHSVFYRELFDQVGFNAQKITCVDDIKVLPIIDKNILLRENERIQSDYRFKKLFFSETSGTTGQVLKFYRNEEWESGHRAAMFRGYHWYGVKVWEKNGYFWGYNIDKKQKYKVAFLDFLQNRFRMFSYDKEELKRFIKRLRRAAYLEGYSSMIYETAKMVNQLPERKNDFKLKMVKGTSEKIYESYQEGIQKAFGLKMISEYGSTESGIIAYECPEGGHMHICMENVIVEEVNGEIVVTNLLSYSFPIIRYKLGDYVKLADKTFRCKCGREHSVILDILGRVGKCVKGYVQQYPSLMFYYVFKNIALTTSISLNYQAIQKEIGKVDLRIEQNQPEYQYILQRELDKYFKKDVDFKIVWGQTLHTWNGKLRDFISELD